MNCILNLQGKLMEQYVFDAIFETLYSSHTIQLALIFHFFNILSFGFNKYSFKAFLMIRFSTCCVHIKANSSEKGQFELPGNDSKIGMEEDFLT